MGKSNDSSKQVQQQAQAAYQQTRQPTQTETEMGPLSQTMTNNYNTGTQRNMQDYTDTMDAYKNFRNNLSFTRVNAPNPAELGESYGYMREAMPGYRNFAQTGGFSPQDLQDLRARGVSPIRAAYGNTMMQLDRARALGGNGGAPNYIAALSRAQRELPGQMADAMQGVNAGIAHDVQQGKEFGLQGMSGTGSAMGGLASQAASRDLQAQLANQEAEQRMQGMGLQSISGQGSLFGTSPGMASTFGNQALDSYRNRIAAEQSRNQLGLGYLGMQNQAYANRGQPWWQTALGIGGTIAGML